MSRLEIGYLASKVLAVVAALAALRFLWIVPTFFAVPVLDGGVEMYEQVGWPIAGVAAILILLLMAAHLWSQAPNFGRWDAAPKAEGALDRFDAAYLAARSIGTYLAVLSVFAVYNWGRVFQFNLAYSGEDVRLELAIVSLGVFAVPAVAGLLWFGGGRFASWVGRQTASENRFAAWSRLAFAVLGTFLIGSGLHLMALLLNNWAGMLWTDPALSVAQRIRLYGVMTQAGAGVLLVMVSLAAPRDAPAEQPAG
jgi:hypothetical protein